MPVDVVRAVDIDVLEKRLQYVICCQHSLWCILRDKDCGTERIQ